MRFPDSRCSLTEYHRYSPTRLISMFQRLGFAIFCIVYCIAVRASPLNIRATQVGLTGDLTCTKLQQHQAPFCYDLINYDVSSIILPDTLQRDRLAKLGMVSTELAPKCSFYASKQYNCRKLFPPCVNQIAEDVREHRPVQHNHPASALKGSPPALVQYKICKSSCLAANDLSKGACKFFSPAYFENECSQSQFYDQTDEYCEKYGAASALDKSFMTRLSISITMGMIGLLIALSSWRHHKHNKNLLERLEKEALIRDKTLMKQKRTTVELDLAIREMQKYKYGQSMVDRARAEEVSNNDVTNEGVRDKGMTAEGVTAA